MHNLLTPPGVLLFAAQKKRGRALQVVCGQPPGCWRKGLRVAGGVRATARLLAEGSEGVALLERDRYIYGPCTPLASCLFFLFPTDLFYCERSSQLDIQNRSTSYPPRPTKRKR